MGNAVIFQEEGSQGSGLWVDRLRKKRKEAAAKVEHLDRAIALLGEHPELEAIYAAVSDNEYSCRS